ncbi:response regulator transcription factor [Mitsuaria sp. GD03876]|uniref:response regulator transcription factor n=1 Tax=Mitsuaria sp. GD03876 TaxID=2975399 RepID=UPI002449C0A9|nr:response regulator transcription factor [Mitsuaria sp. GD03876]MDH0866601.1 response regulator transcription factor [Mitsuaria sp. GD03876]
MTTPGTLPPAATTAARAPAPAHLAILDDEPDITLLLAGYLGSHGFRTTQLHDGRALMDLMATDAPDLVLLDLGLPGEDGFVIARQLREHWRCGLVIVTGRGDAVDKVVGLEIGADDYVTKPFDLRELVARVKAVLRRMAPAPAPDPASASATGAFGAPGAASPAGEFVHDLSAGRERLHFEGWTVDIAARQVTGPDGDEVALTTGEFDLLHTFLLHPGRVLSRDFLLEHTRGRESGPFDRTIDVQVGRLRRKLGAESGEGQWIKSVRGAGYLFAPRVTSTLST